MNRIFPLMLAGVLLAGCSRQIDSDDQPRTSTAPKSGTSHGQLGVTMDAATQEKIGLTVQPVSALQLTAEKQAYGRVMDPTSFAGFVGDFTAAQSANNASQAELQRLKTLAAQNNTSTRALETAEVGAARDEAQLTSARIKLVSTCGAAIAARTDLSALVQSLASMESALVRVDLPAGEHLESIPATARFISLSGNECEGTSLGAMAMVDAQTQGQGWLFAVQTNTAKLLPGEAVTAFLAVSGAAQPGFLIPRAAVIRQAGETWVYVQTNGTNLVRQHIVLARPVKDGWFVTDGVQAGDRLVVTGAQAVFSQELNRTDFNGGDRD